MKIFSASQIREWDQYTIQHEPVSSIDLMERAATACFDWITQHYNPNKKFVILCGTGNNGGDGLVIARLMHQAKLQVEVCIMKSNRMSDDCDTNLQRLKKLSVPIHEINKEEDFPIIKKEDVVIDALFGTGLNKPLESLAAALVTHVNFQEPITISIDLPSGMFADATTPKDKCIKAIHTLSFQCNKLAFMMAENESLLGNVEILDICLHRYYYENTSSKFEITGEASIKSIYKPRNQSGHKYTYGHALLFAGSKNMMGAAVLCGKACLRSGAGLVTIHTADERMHIIQTAFPEAISSAETDVEKLIQKKLAIGFGPGLEISEENNMLLKKLIIGYDGALVIDASALQLLVPHVNLLQTRTKNKAILTPHTGEFEKLFGKTNDDFERTALAIEKAATHQCYIVLKGHHTLIACPDGTAFFNNTGNSGMATAGSGDVLTGIITGLCAQGYHQKEACILAVHIHGLAGDIAAEQLSEEAMIAGDIIENLGKAFKTFKT